MDTSIQMKVKEESAALQCKDSVSIMGQEDAWRRNGNPTQYRKSMDREATVHGLQSWIVTLAAKQQQMKIIHNPQ